ncbi:MAG: cytochrome C oxidase subunit IV family protein [Nannocystaceae bacterium]
MSGEHAHAHPNYIKIWAILVFLLLVSVAGPMLEHPIITLITAFGIAFVKAFLVAKHFMHLNIEKKLATYLLCTAVAFMLLFFAGTAPDIMRHEGQNWEHQSAKHETARALKAAEHDPAAH